MSRAVEGDASPFQLTVRARLDIFKSAGLKEFGNTEAARAGCFTVQYGKQTTYV